MSRLMVFKRCACQVWPLDALVPVGRCHRCGTSPTLDVTVGDYAELHERFAAANRRIMELEADLARR